MTLFEAHAKVVKANEALAAAEYARDDALNHLDKALAAQGWQRYYAAGVDALYVKLGGTPVSLDAVLRHELGSVAA